jgi:hypothetical protein
VKKAGVLAKGQTLLRGYARIFQDHAQGVAGKRLRLLLYCPAEGLHDVGRQFKAGPLCQLLHRGGDIRFRQNSRATHPAPPTSP